MKKPILRFCFAMLAGLFTSEVRAQCPTTMTAMADQFVGLFHGGAFSDQSGKIFAWGEHFPLVDGSNYVEVTSDAGKSAYGIPTTVTPLKVTGGTSGLDGDYLAFLGDDNKIYFKGYSVAPMVSGSVHNIDLPPGVLAENVTSFWGNFRTLAIVDGATGRGYVYTGNWTNSDTGANYFRGDGSSSNFRYSWGSAVQTSEPGNPVLENIVQIRGDLSYSSGPIFGSNMIALTSDGDVYIWGYNTMTPGSTAGQNLNYATKINLPEQMTGKVILVQTNVGSSTTSAYLASHYILTDTKELWAVGANKSYQLGVLNSSGTDFINTNITDWQRVAIPNPTGPGFVYPEINYFSTEEHDAVEGGDNNATITQMITTDGALYSFGNNQYGLQGTSSSPTTAGTPPAISYNTNPSLPMDGSTPDQTAAYVETGSHLSFIVKGVSNDYTICAAGHGVTYSLLGSTEAVSQYDYSKCASNLVNPCTIEMVLPVTLSEAYVSLEPCQNTIKWHAATEIALRHYEVQVSHNGKDFSTMSITPAKGSDQSYQFADTELGLQRKYYRLKMVDLDGSVNYSHIMISNNTCAKSEVTVRPTVSSTVVEVTNLTGNETLAVLSHSGYVMVKRQATQQTEKISVTSLPAGMYFLHVSDESTGRISVHKIIKE